MKNQIIKQIAAYEFLLDKGFQESTLDLLNETNLLKLANDYGWGNV